MKQYILLTLALVFSVFPLAAENEKLEDYLDGVLNSHELAIGLHKEDGRALHIVSYLGRLKLKDDSSPVPPELYYDLWRHYLDCHHLCEVFYHQTYIISEKLPIVQVLETAFPGFRKAAVSEGGVWISSGFEFLQTVDPHEKVRQAARGEK